MDNKIDFFEFKKGVILELYRKNLINNEQKEKAIELLARKEKKH